MQQIRNNGHFKLLQFILWWNLMSVPNFMATHPIVVRTFQSNINRHKWHWSLNQGITKVNNIHPLGSMNVCTKFHGNWFNSCWDIGAKWWTDLPTFILLNPAPIWLKTYWVITKPFHKNRWKIPTMVYWPSSLVCGSVPLSTSSIVPGSLWGLSLRTQMDNENSLYVDFVDWHPVYLFYEQYV